MPDKTPVKKYISLNFSNIYAPQIIIIFCSSYTNKDWVEICLSACAHKKCRNNFRIPKIT